MPVPSTVADLSSTASSNYPSGSESIGTSLDDYLRAHASIIKQVSDAKADSSTAVTLTGTQTLQNKTLDGTNSLSGNLSLTGTGARITGDFSNATVSNRVMFQTSAANGSTSLGVIPNGAGTSSGLAAFYGSSGNYSYVEMKVDSSSGQLAVVGNATGSGTQYPMTFYTSGSERMRILPSGVIQVGSGSSGATGSSDFFNIVSSGTAQVYTRWFQTGIGEWSAGTPSGANAFVINSGSGAGTERLRIDSAGYVKSISNAKAWVNFDGTLSGTITPRANLNIASVTKNGTGDYTLNIAASVLADANYSCVVSVGSGSTGNYYTSNSAAAAPSTTSRRIVSATTAGSPVDATYINATIFGN